jgi:hypothetical protein
MSFINDNYTLTTRGKHLIIRFATLTVNDSIYPSDNISITIAQTNEVVFTHQNTQLILDYTNDTGDSSASVEDYVDDIISRIRIQEILLQNAGDVTGGDVSGSGAINKFGRNNDIDTTTDPEDIWNGAGDYSGQDATGSEIVDVFSSSTDDDVAGIGALTVQLSGLKTSTSIAYETEDIVLTGTVIANSISSWWRINRVTVLTAGSTGNNVGEITVRQTTTTTVVFAIMPASFNQTSIAAYTIPYATTGYLVKYQMQIVRASGAEGSALATLRIRESSTGVFKSQEIVDLQTGAVVTGDYRYPVVLPAGTDMKLRCESVSDNNTQISGGFSIFLLDD